MAFYQDLLSQNVQKKTQIIYNHNVDLNNNLYISYKTSEVNKNNNTELKHVNNLNKKKNSYNDDLSNNKYISFSTGSCNNNSSTNYSNTNFNCSNGNAALSTTTKSITNTEPCTTRTQLALDNAFTTKHQNTTMLLARKTTQQTTSNIVVEKDVVDIDGVAETGQKKIAKNMFETKPKVRCFSNKKTKLLNKIRNQSQRTLGSQFHVMNRTLRVVRITFNGNDPLMNDYVWLALICDLVCTGFCNVKAVDYIRRKSSNTFDMIPLALQNDCVNDWVMYKRVLNQIPLNHCVRLCVFRWICELSKNALKLIPTNKEEHNEFHTIDFNNTEMRKEYFKSCRKKTIPPSVLVQVRDLCSEFIRTGISDSKSSSDSRKKYKGPAASKQDRTKKYLGVTTKLKCRLTSVGQALLCNSCGTFQPVVPETLKYPTENSLRNEHLYAPDNFLISVYNERIVPSYSIYEHDRRIKVPENKGLTLGNYRWENEPFDDGKSPITSNRLSTYLHVIRRNLFQHLAGCPESSAIYGLHQFYGNHNKFHSKLNEIKIFLLKTILSHVEIGGSNEIKKSNNYYFDKIRAVTGQAAVQSGEAHSSRSSIIKTINERTPTKHKSTIRKTPFPNNTGNRFSWGVKRRKLNKPTIELIDTIRGTDSFQYMPWKKKRPKKSNQRNRRNIEVTELQDPHIALLNLKKNNISKKALNSKHTKTLKKLDGLSKKLPNESVEDLKQNEEDDEDADSDDGERTEVHDVINANLLLTLCSCTTNVVINSKEGDTKSI